MKRVLFVLAATLAISLAQGYVRVLETHVSAVDIIHDGRFTRDEARAGILPNAAQLDEIEAANQGM